MATVVIEEEVPVVIEVGIMGPQGPPGTLIEVEEDGVIKTTPLRNLDFRTGFDVTEPTSRTAQIDLDLSEVSAGGELAGTLDAPTVDALHSGSTHQSLTDNLNAHLVDVVDSHDASAISFIPTGTIVSADAQSAIVEALTDGKAYTDDGHVILSSQRGAVDGVAGLDSGGTVPDAQIPAAVARDSEVSAAAAGHVAAADPHTGYQKESEKSAASGYAALDSTGKVPTSQIPAVAFGNVFVVASQAEMLALAANPGDIAVRSDVSQTFILTALPASTLGNWVELLSGAGGVTSVNGATGAVTGVELTANKGAVSGYAALDGSGFVPDAQINPAIARDSEFTAADTAHAAAGDPHTGYQKESEKGAVSGYASLDGSGAVPDAQIPSAVARDSEVTAAVVVHLAADTGTTGKLHIRVSEPPPMIHVSTTGDDTFDGRWDRPKLTVAAGFTAVATAGGIVHLGGGTFTERDLDFGHDGVTLEGAGKHVTTLRTTAAGANLFALTSASTRTDITVKDISLLSTSGAGHIFYATKGLSQGHFLRVAARQDNDGKSIYDSSGTATYLDNDWIECFLQHTQTSTVPAFKFVGTSNDVSVNRWEKCRLLYSGTWFFSFDSQSGGGYFYDNVFRDINAEVLRGGFLKTLSCRDFILDGVSNYDMATVGASLNDWIVFGKSAASALLSKGMTLRHVNRRNGSLGAGLYDVRYLTGECNYPGVLESLQSGTDSGFKIDLGNTGGLTLMDIPSLVTVDNAPYWTTYLNRSTMVQADKIIPKYMTGAGQSTIADADFAFSAGVNGTLAVIYDSTAGVPRLAFRANGTWNYVGPGSGVSSFAKSGDTALTGAVTVSGGSGITLTESGQNVAIAATGSAATDFLAAERWGIG